MSREEAKSMVFKNYEYFIAIVESGSLTKAAEKLYVSQPSLSQYVKRLESSLGVELFDRTASPLRLTYTGERYYEYVKQVRELGENVEREFSDIKNQTSGRLRLGVAVWRGAHFLPEVFPAFYEAYPNIRLELKEDRSAALEEALMDDKLDVAVMNLPRSLHYDKLTCEIFFEERILLAAPTQHPAVRRILENCRVAGARPVAPLTLVKEIPLLITKPGQNLTHEIMHVLGKNGIEANILLETGNLTTAINLATKGMGCVFVPEMGAETRRYQDALTYFAVDTTDLVWDFGAVYRRGIYLPRLARLFIDCAKQQLAQEFGKKPIT